MNTTPECLPCLFRQALLTARQITDDPQAQLAAVQVAARQFDHITLDRTPPENARLISDALDAHFGSTDPFREARFHYNQTALQAYDTLHDHVHGAADPLAAAVRVAAVGNIMDLAVFEAVDVSEAITQAQTMPLAIDDIDAFRADITAAGTVLVLGDNAGEIVFDLPLVEILPARQIYYAVKSGPAANDVTLEDALQVGMDRFATVIGTGANYMGCPLDRCSVEFRAIFDAADVIIAKGQANFETLSDTPANLYFVVRAKCQTAAAALGVGVGDVVLKRQAIRA
jgi:uncharacterized protein with ATP-grasp and redox domains